jgi:AcrR family transcriptional regulator
MGINRPSLYSTFGNKQSLFKKALDRYSHGPASYVRLALAQPTARKVAESLLYGAIDLIARPHHPKGCLMVQGALSCSDSNDCIRRELASRRLAAQSALRRRLDRAKKEGDLPKSANPAALAQYLATILHGLSVQAATGATPAQLRQVVATALGAWPT